MKAFAAIADVLQEAFKLSRACSRMAERRRGRRELQQLDRRLLADIGLTRDAAEREIRKWFWQ